MAGAPRVISVNISEKVGEQKHPVPEAEAKVNHGLVGDAHARDWHRQISLLAMESIKKMQEKGLDVGPGAFAENLTTENLDLAKLPVGTKLKIGETLTKVTQIGKTCHAKCAIYRQVGDCVFPREGIFVKVLKEGKIRPGDLIEIIPSIRVGVLTLSDKGSKGEREDLSGKVIQETLADIAEVTKYEIIPDEYDQIIETLTAWTDSGECDLILTTGGTGFGPRDVTPDATEAVIQRRVPGLPEAMRAKGLEKTNRAMLSRATAGIRGKTLIVNLPGSPKGVRENLEVILPVLPHAIGILTGSEGECAR
ncbi:MAG: molybdenum cofactor biosynthesis protein [Firmicutes bacterium]|nr:molybdenum cofactor biosynthesis protein [Bacillota bacterium]